MSKAEKQPEGKILVQEGIPFYFRFKPQEEDLRQALHDVQEEMKGQTQDIARVEVGIKSLPDGTQRLDYVVHKEKFQRIRRITGYLVGDLDRCNNGKQREEKDRLPHRWK
ncbi:MAG: hypothetical protein GX786_01495 [Clostridiales bacterium]|nr:hypothetical protein [Clostridiales bacterium]